MPVLLGRRGMETCPVWVEARTNPLIAQLSCWIISAPAPPHLRKAQQERKQQRGFSSLKGQKLSTEKGQLRATKAHHQHVSVKTC